MNSPQAFLFTGGTVHQGAGTKPASWALAEKGRIREVGFGSPPDAPGAARWDLRGGWLIPAFCDAHVHLSWIATSFLGCDLGAAESAEELLALLRSWRGPGRGPAGEWTVGYGFDESSWAVPRLPTRDELDALEPLRPLLVQRVCGHVGVVNSRALERLRPGPHTDVRSGRLAEDDLYAVNDLLRPSAAQLAETLPRVAATLHEHGITAVQDVTSPEMLSALRQAGEIGIRVRCAMPARYLQAPAVGAGLPARDPAAFFAAHALDDVPLGTDDNPRVLGLKLFLDGSLGARTAYLRASYADAPATRGTALYPHEELASLVARADAAGLQLMVHAIGDAALDQALDVLSPLVREGNPLRHRIEHAEVTPPDMVERLARTSLRVCVQPNFAGRWSVPGGLNEQRLGSRLAHCNAYRTLREAGVALAFGSDCMPLGPLFGVRSAVEHPVAQERLDLEGAIDLYTTGSRELVLGPGGGAGITPGAPADLVVLEPASQGGAPRAKFRVAATFAAGRLVQTTGK